ncbi:MAG: hypothetical protein RLZZ546_902 [Bacteroidota bacterium]|jgi:carboxypeptidase Taq
MAFYKDYVQKMQKIADISNAVSILYWDDEVYLPKNANQLRAQQLATLSGLSHKEFTDPKLGVLLKSLSKQKLTFKQRKNIELTLKDFNKDKKFSTEFIEAKTSLISQAYHSWGKARQENNFSHFEKNLDSLIKTIKQEADIIGYKNHPYDAMIDLYEPGMTVDKLDVIFQDVKQNLLPFIKEKLAKQKVNDRFLHKKYPKDLQWKFGLDCLNYMGFDFTRGRQDISLHPFTTSFGADDVRITTRIDEKDVSNMVWSTIHEGGHALYEQGLDPNEYGLPSGTASSLGIHESQSRLWENNVGRSYSFWKYHFPKLKKIFPSQLEGVSIQNFMKAINKIGPNKIRTEADELHYHIHILIRYEIEKEIMESKIKAKELPKLWNKKYKDYLNVDIQNYAEGILQDVHWSHGSFGYFPTYTLGSFYAAQFMEKASKDIRGLDSQLKKGNTSELKGWLKKNVFQHGKTYTAEELCKQITGEPLNMRYFMTYVKEKFDQLENL